MNVIPRRPSSIALRGTPRRAWSLLRRVARGVLHWLGASLLAQFALGALLVVGWAQERMHRRVSRIWGNAPPAPSPALRRWRAYAGRGLQTTACSAIALIGPLGLLCFAWWSGWNASFHKEDPAQAGRGPLLGLLALGLFSLVMPLLPWAQARLALTRDWRAFFELPFVFGLARRHWPTSLGLGLLSGLLWLPILWLQAAPAFLGNLPELEDLDDAELLNVARLYYLAGTALLVLPSYLLLRSLAARGYARGLGGDVRRGRVEASALHPEERRGLAEQLPAAPIPPSRPGRLRRAVRLGGTLMLGATSSTLWMSLGAAMLVRQFLSYRTFDWFNPALFVLPWVKFIPEHLQ